MWADQHPPQTIGPITASPTLSGVTVSLTATLASTDWNMGDGTTVHCTRGQRRRHPVHIGELQVISVH